MPAPAVSFEVMPGADVLPDRGGMRIARAAMQDYAIEVPLVAHQLREAGVLQPEGAFLTGEIEQGELVRIERNGHESPFARSFSAGGFGGLGLLKQFAHADAGKSFESRRPGASRRTTLILSETISRVNAFCDAAIAATNLAAGWASGKVAHHPHHAYRCGLLWWVKPGYPCRSIHHADRQSIDASRGTVRSLPRRLLHAGQASLMLSIEAFALLTSTSTTSSSLLLSAI